MTKTQKPLFEAVRADAKPTQRPVAAVRIESNIPIPEPWSINRLNGGSGSPLRDLLRQLQVGDSFDLTAVVKSKNPAGGLYEYAKEIGIKTAVRKMPDGHMRCWRIA